MREMKRLASIIAMMLLLALQVSAQDNKRQPRFNPEEFRARLEAFITQRACLTQEESTKVFPIYQEMKDKERQLKQQEYKLKRNIMQSEKDKDYQDALNQITQLRIEAAKIEESYYKKMCKAVPAKKAYAIMLAEDAFHREVLNSIEKRNKNRQQPQKKP